MTRRNQHGNPLKRFRMVFWEISKLRISENLYKIWWIYMSSWVQYVAENALFIFTPGFLSIKSWWRERRTWGALPSRHFGDGAQVQREMERCHVRWLLLGDEKWCSQNKIPSTGQKDMSLSSEFSIHIYFTYNSESALISKRRANQRIL